MKEKKTKDVFNYETINRMALGRQHKYNTKPPIVHHKVDLFHNWLCIFVKLKEEKHSSFIHLEDFILYIYI